MTVLKDLYGKPCKGDWMPKLAKILEHSSGTRQVSVSVFFSNHRLLYGRPFVSKLWHNIRAVFSHIYLQSFLLHDIRAFFCHVYLRFIPKYMTIFLQTRIYMRTKNPYICVTNKHVVYAVAESRRIRGTELYRQQKTSSCTMELKSNFSLNQAWSQCPL